MAPTMLFVLCIAAFVAVAAVSVLFAGGGSASRGQKERLANRHAAFVAAKEKAAAAPVVPLPTVEADAAPARGEAAA